MAHPRGFLLLASLLLVAATFSYSDDLNRQLHDGYADKTLVVRGFYSGDRLRYDSSGSLVGSNPSGDWTSDGFVRIIDIDVTGHEIRINQAFCGLRQQVVFPANRGERRPAADQATRRSGEDLSFCE